jgi:hypothetical protein
MAMHAILILAHPSTSSYNTFYISKRRTSHVKCRWRVADHDDGKHTKSIHHIQGGMGAMCADSRYPFPLILFTGLLRRIVFQVTGNIPQTTNNSPIRWPSRDSIDQTPVMANTRVIERYCHHSVNVNMNFYARWYGGPLTPLAYGERACWSDWDRNAYWILVTQTGR